ncbi:MAG TPA: glycoside hydrolase family 2, partial [Terracidiphilus sp.]
MQIRFSRSSFSALALLLAFLAPVSATAKSAPPQLLVLAAGWQLQDAAKVPQSGAEVAAPGFNAAGWLNATVPGTVLTTLVNNHVYPEPLYGENNRPETIPESLARTSWWYRNLIDVPMSYKGQRIWLNFDGINYSATVWVNGTQVGTMRGAFTRGIFDISPNVKPGHQAVLAVLVAPQPHPGVSHEHTLRDGLGQNGGETAIDGPTFLSTIGWDWIPAIRDRDTGIWQKVFLSATGPVLVKDPLV